MRKCHMTIKTSKCCPGRLERTIISYRVILETYTLTQPQLSNRFWATVCKTVRPMLSVRCPVLSVCPVCDVRALWLKMPGDFVLDGDPARPLQKGAQPAVFGPCLLWPNGWMDQDATWYGSRPWPGENVLDGAQLPPPAKWAQPPIFGPRLLWPNSWMNHDATWCGGRPKPRRRCVRWGPISPVKGAHPSSFRPISVVAKRLDD